MSIIPKPDRLAEIKAELTGTFPEGYEQFAETVDKVWLLMEVERLRAKLNSWLEDDQICAGCQGVRHDGYLCDVTKPCVCGHERPRHKGWQGDDGCRDCDCTDMTPVQSA